MRALLAALLFAASPALAGDFWAVATIGSYHFNRDKAYNERNFGLGVEYGMTENTRFVAGFYDNSKYKHTNYVGAVWTPINLGGFTRAGLVGMCATGYADNVMCAPIPTITLEGRRFGANFVIAPTFKDVDGAIALQLKVKF